MRGKTPTRLGVRTVPVLVAAACLSFAGCTPSAIRIPAGEADTLRRIAVVPMESPGPFPYFYLSLFFNGYGGPIYIAGEHDNGVLSPDSQLVLLDGLMVFVQPPRADAGGSGPAERFEKALAGPRSRWFPSADLAEAAARMLREGGRDATAIREIVRIPGVSGRGPGGVPRDGYTRLSDWYGKDPDPLDLEGYRDRGVQAVLVVVCNAVGALNNRITVVLWAKLVDPADGRAFGRADATGRGEAPAYSWDQFPGQFRSASGRAVAKALKEMGLVR